MSATFESESTPAVKSLADSLRKIAIDNQDFTLTVNDRIKQGCKTFALNGLFSASLTAEPRLRKSGKLIGYTPIMINGEDKRPLYRVKVTMDDDKIIWTNVDLERLVQLLKDEGLQVIIDDKNIIELAWPLTEGMAIKHRRKPIVPAKPLAEHLHQIAVNKRDEDPVLNLSRTIKLGCSILARKGLFSAVVCTEMREQDKEGQTTGIYTPVMKDADKNLRVSIKAKLDIVGDQIVWANVDLDQLFKLLQDNDKFVAQFNPAGELVISW